LRRAAGEVFAEVGFRAATVRAICQRAGANIAAVNYHFGDKAHLYVEVLRDAYRVALEQPPDDLGVVPRATPPQRLQAFVHGFLRRLLDPDPSAWHWKVLALELIQPSAALDALVAERLRPLAEQVRGIVQTLLGPGADPEIVRLGGSSVVGQCLFYRHCHSVISRLFPEQGFGPDAIARIAAHITRFSLAGLQAHNPSRRARDPARSQAGGGSRQAPSSPAASAGKARQRRRTRPRSSDPGLVQRGQAMNRTARPR